MTTVAILKDLDKISVAYKQRGHELCNFEGMTPQIMKRNLKEYLAEANFEGELSIMNAESKQRFFKQAEAGENNINGSIGRKMRHMHLKNASNSSNNSNLDSGSSTGNSETGTCSADGIKSEPGSSSTSAAANDVFSISVHQASLHLRNLIFRRETSSGVVHAQSHHFCSSSSDSADWATVDFFESLGGDGTADTFLGLAEVDIAPNAGTGGRRQYGDGDSSSAGSSSSYYSELYTSSSGGSSSGGSRERAGSMHRSVSHASLKSADSNASSSSSSSSFERDSINSSGQQPTRQHGQQMSQEDDYTSAALQMLLHRQGMFVENDDNNSKEEDDACSSGNSSGSSSKRARRH
jgi:hypothetical protein